MLRRPGAPSYEVIIDELAIRRLAAPPDVVKKQLYHLATACNGTPSVALRVLPVDARIDGFTVPRCTFSIYTYPDPGDPAVVAIDTVTSDLVLTDPADAAPYDQLYTGCATPRCRTPTASTCSPRPPPNSPTTNHTRSSRPADKGTPLMNHGTYAGWRKSSYSNDSGNCVEVAPADAAVGVRDSKQHGRGPVLEFTRTAWADIHPRRQGRGVRPSEPAEPRSRDSVNKAEARPPNPGCGVGDRSHRMRPAASARPAELLALAADAVTGRDMRDVLLARVSRTWPTGCWLRSRPGGPGPGH